MSLDCYTEILKNFPNCEVWKIGIPNIISPVPNKYGHFSSFTPFLKWWMRDKNHLTIRPHIFGLCDGSMRFINFKAQRCNASSTVDDIIAWLLLSPFSFLPLPPRSQTYITVINPHIVPQKSQRNQQFLCLRRAQMFRRCMNQKHQ